METVTAKETKSSVALQPTVTRQIHAISSRYVGRGLARAVVLSAEEQIKAEKETMEQAPAAYRMSTLSSAAVTGLYKHGKETMSGSDLICYFDETRQSRIKDCDFSQSSGIYESSDPKCDEDTPETALVLIEPEKKALASVRELPGMAVTKLKESLPLWFSLEEDDQKNSQKRKFPLSAFAAMIAVAVSLMLIIASSVMLTRAESRISSLTLEAETLSDEISELQSDIDADSDMLALREIAVEEYGMIDREYVQMTYLENEREETIEAYEEERQGGIGLASLLSAMGIKK